jgi:hypothetical protein
MVIMLRPHSAVRPSPALIKAAARSVSTAGAAAAPLAVAAVAAGALAGGGNWMQPTSTPNCRAGQRRAEDKRDR